MDNKNIIISLNDNNNVTQDQLSNENSSIEVEQVQREESFFWTDANTKFFLSLYKENIDLLAERKIKTKKILWKKISEKMQLQGYNVSALQVENKYKSLERSFKNIKTHNKKTGRNRLSCPYETELTEILGGKHSIEPLLLSGNKDIIVRNEKSSTSL
ncbi:uncharacterized protein [Linepithema humile]|uniref:uncharacterized protein n=1 Tax=Linepithema humile TaxID=83485 RepID=UPI00351DEAF2